MDQSQPNELTPPELRPLMDAEFKIDGLASTADLPNLHSAVSDANGVESVSFFEGELAVRYDSELITKAEICELIRKAGFRVAESKNAPIAPRIESAEGEHAALKGSEEASGGRSEPGK